MDNTRSVSTSGASQRGRPSLPFSEASQAHARPSVGHTPRHPTYIARMPGGYASPSSSSNAGYSPRPRYSAASAHRNRPSTGAVGDESIQSAYFTPGETSLQHNATQPRRRAGPRKSAYETFDEVGFCNDLASRIASELSRKIVKRPHSPAVRRDHRSDIGWRGSGRGLAGSASQDALESVLSDHIDSGVQTDTYPNDQSHYLDVEEDVPDTSLLCTEGADAASDNDLGGDDGLRAERTERTKAAAEAFLQRVAQRHADMPTEAEMGMEGQVLALFGHHGDESTDNLDEPRNSHQDYTANTLPAEVETKVSAMLRPKSANPSQSKNLIEMINDPLANVDEGIGSRKGDCVVAAAESERVGADPREFLDSVNEAADREVDDEDGSSASSEEVQSDDEEEDDMLVDEDDVELNRSASDAQTDLQDQDDERFEDHDIDSQKQDRYGRILSHLYQEEDEDNDLSTEAASDNQSEQEDEELFSEEYNNDDDDEEEDLEGAHRHERHEQRHDRTLGTMGDAAAISISDSDDDEDRADYVAEDQEDEVRDALTSQSPDPAEQHFNDDSTEQWAPIDQDTGLPASSEALNAFLSDVLASHQGADSERDAWSNQPSMTALTGQKIDDLTSETNDLAIPSNMFEQLASNENVLTYGGAHVAEHGDLQQSPMSNTEIDLSHTHTAADESPEVPDETREISADTLPAVNGLPQSGRELLNLKKTAQALVDEERPAGSGPTSLIAEVPDSLQDEHKSPAESKDAESKAENSLTERERLQQHASDDVGAVAEEELNQAQFSLPQKQPFEFQSGGDSAAVPEASLTNLTPEDVEGPPTSTPSSAHRRHHHHHPHRRSDPHGDLANYVPEEDISDLTPSRRRLRSASLASSTDDAHEDERKHIEQNGIGENSLIDLIAEDIPEAIREEAGNEQSPMDAEESDHQKTAADGTDGFVKAGGILERFEERLAEEPEEAGEADRLTSSRTESDNHVLDEQEQKRADSRKRHKKEYDRRRKKQKKEVMSAADGEEQEKTMQVASGLAAGEGLGSSHLHSGDNVIVPIEEGDREVAHNTRKARGTKADAQAPADDGSEVMKVAEPATEQPSAGMAPRRSKRNLS